VHRRPTAPRVALATGAEWPDLDEDSAPLVPALRERGIDVALPVWRDPEVEWERFDAVVVRSVWDYFDHQEEFVAWAERVGAVTRLLNTPEVLTWNSHKSYLRDLESKGVPVVDTVWAARGEHVDLAETLRTHGWHDAVFKPAVGGGAEGLVRVDGSAEASAAQPTLDLELTRGDVLIQPLLPSIEHEGELSLFFAGGEHTHTIRKRPKAGDIRVQPEWGGIPDVVEAPQEAVAVAARAVAGAPAELLYARVDLVRALDGTLRLIELEVIEPRLFLTLAPHATRRFADAIQEWI
jgi:glutathione synthase/RimK-type ligase-like ATP-grasp enzyme